MTWNDTPAGLIRNQGWYAEDAALEKALEITSTERRAARDAFDAAWSDRANWSADADGNLIDARSIQRDLAARGWTGQFIGIGHTQPPELQPLFAAYSLSKTVMATDAAGRKDAEAIRVDQETHQRFEAAKARMDAILGPLANTINFGV
jgi:hypothetical protein